MHVLLIEDCDTDAGLAEAALLRERVGVRPVTRARSLAEASDLAGRGRFDAVVLDLGLPDSRGLETLRAVRDRLGPAMPVVVLTGLDDEIVAAAAVRAGAQDYVAKGALPTYPLGRAVRYATERVRAAEALKESEARYRQLFDGLPSACIAFDNDTLDILMVNEAAVRTYGWSREEFAGMAVRDMLAPEDVPRLLACRAQWEQGVTFFGTRRHRRKDGAEVWVDVTCRPFLLGERRARLAVLTDVTEREAARRRAAASERFAQATLDGLSAHVAVLDAEGNVLAVNEAWRRFGAGNGLRPGKAAAAAAGPLVGVNYLRVCDGACGASAEGAREAAEGILRVIRGDVPSYYQEYPCHAPGGERRWFAMRVTRFAGDGPARAVVAHEDVTARRSAEEAAGRNEERYGLVSRATNDVLWDWDAVADTLYCGDALERVYGYGQRQIPGGLAFVQDVIHPDDRKRVMDGLRAAMEGGGESWADEYRLRRADGTYAAVLDRGYMVRDAGGRVVRMVGSLLDLTERERAAALERERAALDDAVRAMDRVLGVVGHELRTPLAGLRAIGELLQGVPDRNAADCDALVRAVHDEAVRMSDTVDHLLEVARLNSGRARWDWGEADVGAACAEAVETVRPLVDPARVQLCLSAEVEGLTIRGDRCAVRRLVLNLLNNARKHTEGGHIRVAWRREGPRPTDDPAGGGWAVVTVTDTGPGIDPSVIERLGEAFALNAGVVGANQVDGAGLGLAICRGIVAAHGGDLTVLSAPGRGTTVTARLRTDLEGPVQSSGRRTLFANLAA